VALHQYDTVDKNIIEKKTGKFHEVLVPILNPENFGEDMAIDDKGISREGYTVLSNKKSGKIAALIMSTKSSIVCEVLQNIPGNIRMNVKTISKDLAAGYDWVARTMFMNAQRVGDKFHVLKLGFEAMQAVRIRCRQEVLTKEREEQKTKTNKRKYENGETKKELLARGRYLLFKFRIEWTRTQEERAEILFREFPEIKTAYELVVLFREFYSIPLGNREKAKEALKKWHTAVSQKNIEELLNFSFTVQRHEPEILNYFDEGHTNAFAESLNSKIESFLNANSGTRDRNFFHFRLKRYFS